MKKLLNRLFKNESVTIQEDHKAKRITERKGLFNKVVLITYK